ncbi:MAG TPA: bifunctional enoyl-CoA hydratase/phosphate acetyltransferase [Thermoanaerobaculia bacterium]|jgi:phosphotransacetylase|nr:bifunctional enoyl-CoA hydratase/phosphate acetyltransferase [Thermoanaerobaculia bacterium]
MGKYDYLLERCGGLEPVAMAVAHPCDEATLVGVAEARRRGLIAPILVGPGARIADVAEAAGIELGDARIVDVPHSHAAAARSVDLILGGEAELLMKGSLSTEEFLAAVLSREKGLRTGRRVSHVYMMDLPAYHKPLMITDAAIHIAPTLEEKAEICQNAIDLAMALGVERPKVAILAAVETVSSKMPSTLDAAALCKMAERGQIRGGALEGPLAFDLAIDRDAADAKGIRSDVAGNADILLVPDLETGNILAKLLGFLTRADGAGLVLGARVPIVLTSRADSVGSRITSCAAARLVAHFRERAA